MNRQDRYTQRTDQCLNLKIFAFLVPAPMGHFSQLGMASRIKYNPQGVSENGVEKL